MTDLGPPWDAVQTATSDQNAALMADLGRTWVAMYRALLDGGMPVAMARSLVERQQSTHCQLMLMAAAAQTGAR